MCGVTGEAAGFRRSAGADSAARSAAASVPAAACRPTRASALRVRRRRRRCGCSCFGFEPPPLPLLVPAVPSSGRSLLLRDRVGEQHPDEFVVARACGCRRSECTTARRRSSAKTPPTMRTRTKDESGASATLRSREKSPGELRVGRDERRAKPKGSRLNSGHVSCDSRATVAQLRREPARQPLVLEERQTVVAARAQEAAACARIFSRISCAIRLLNLSS